MSVSDRAMRDLVHVHITSAIPVRGQALPFADRIEVRFGKAFPLAMTIDADAVDRVIQAIEAGRSEMTTATRVDPGEEVP